MRTYEHVHDEHIKKFKLANCKSILKVLLFQTVRYNLMIFVHVTNVQVIFINFNFVSK